MRKADCRFRCSETTETVMDGLSKLLMEVFLKNVSIDPHELDAISDMIHAIKISSISLQVHTRLGASVPRPFYCFLNFYLLSC